MKKTMIYQIKKSGAVLLGWALSLVLLTMIPLAASAQSSCTLSDTPTDVSRWIESRFAKGKVPPFSFVYDGKPSAGLLRKWKARLSVSKIPNRACASICTRIRTAAAA